MYTCVYIEKNMCVTCVMYLKIVQKEHVCVMCVLCVMYGTRFHSENHAYRTITDDKTHGGSIERTVLRFYITFLRGPF